MFVENMFNIKLSNLLYTKRSKILANTDVNEFGR